MRAKCVLVVLAALSCIGCDDDQTNGSRDAGASDAGDAAAPDSVYALKRYVRLTDEQGSMYIDLTRSVDVEIDSLDTGKSREIFGDLVNFGTGSLFVQSDLEITKYDVTEDLDWVEAGTVSFADYPLAEGASFYFMTMVDERTVYMQYDGYKRLVWDPVALEISAAKEQSELPREVDGLPLHASGNGNYFRFEGKSWLLYTYMDEDWWQFGSKSYAVSYDPKTHEEVERLELPCPGIDTATQDEAGNTYFSSGSYTGVLALYDMGPKPCVVKLNPSGELEQSWTTDLTAVTDGRMVSSLEYARDGFAFINVLHHERLGVKPDDKEIPAEVIEALWEDENWQVWLVNLNDMTGRPLDEVTGRMGQGAVQRIDGRAFLTVGYDEWSRTRMFELGDDNELEQVDDFRGEGAWIKLR